MTTRADLSAVARSCARAEHNKWHTVLAFRDEQVAALDRGDHSSMYRRMGVNAVSLKIAQTLRISEQQVWRILEQGSRLREQLPAAWAAFADGLIDAQKASVLAVAVDRLTDPANRERLDAVVVDHATGHTPPELRRWTDQLDHLDVVVVDRRQSVRLPWMIDLVECLGDVADLPSHDARPFGGCPTPSSRARSMSAASASCR